MYIEVNTDFANYNILFIVSEDDRNCFIWCKETKRYNNHEDELYYRFEYTYIDEPYLISAKELMKVIEMINSEDDREAFNYNKMIRRFAKGAVYNYCLICTNRSNKSVKHFFIVDFDFNTIHYEQDGQLEVKFLEDCKGEI